MLGQRVEAPLKQRNHCFLKTLFDSSTLLVTPLSATEIFNKMIIIIKSSLKISSYLYFCTIITVIRIHNKEEQIPLRFNTIACSSLAHKNLKIIMVLLLEE